MPVIPTVTAKTEKRSNIPYIEVHLIVMSNGEYYIYTVKPFRVLIPGHYSRVYIQMGGGSGPLE